MLWGFYLLLYGVLATYGYPVYDIDDYEGNYPDYEYVEEERIPEIIHRTPRSIESLMKKTSKGAMSMARDFIRTFLPSAAQMGYQGMRRMVKRAAPAPAAKLASVASFQPVPSTPNLAAAFPSNNAQSYNYNSYTYPGMGSSSFYGYGTYPYSSYQYPYYSGSYASQYDTTKRGYFPYAYTNSYYGLSNQVTNPGVQQTAYKYQYPASIAASTAAKQSIASISPSPQPSTIEAEHHSVPDTNTANGISQGLIDLENDVKGFNQAIQYMKAAFIADNDGGSDLEEKIHDDKKEVAGEKKDLIKKKKSSSELIEAFKRTLDSKKKLENKLVNYFTNYVCGDDC